MWVKMTIFASLFGPKVIAMKLQKILIAMVFTMLVGGSGQEVVAAGAPPFPACPVVGDNPPTIDLSFGKAASASQAFSLTGQSTYLGFGDSCALFLERHGRRRDKMDVVCYDLSQSERGRLPLGSADSLTCYGSHVDHSHLTLLMACRAKGEMRVWRERRTLPALAPDGERQELMRMAGEKEDRMDLATTLSPNGRLLACVFIHLRKGLDTEVKVALYDREFEEYWQMTLNSEQLPLFNQFLVSDSGEVVLAELAGGRCRFSVLDGESERTASFRMDGSYLESRLVSYAGGRLMSAAIGIGYVDAMSYDMASGRLSSARHELTNQEMNRLCNGRDDDRVRSREVPFANLSQVLPDAEGAFLVVDQTWTVTVDGVAAAQHRQGALVLRVDTVGNILWTQPLRLQVGAEWDERALAWHEWVATTEGVMLAVVQRDKSVRQPEEKPCLEFSPMRHPGVLVVTCLDRSGHRSTQHFEVGSQGILDAPHKTGNDSYLLQLRGKRKGQFAILTLK